MEIRGNDDNEHLANLERDNRALREQLTIACSKLERIQITLRSIQDSMLSHVSHGSASDLRNSPTSEKEDDDATTCNRTVMPTRSQPETAFETIPSDTYQCDDQIPRPQVNNDVEELFTSILPDDSPTGEHHVVEQNSSFLDSSVQVDQTPADLGMSRLMGNLSDVRGLPGIWTYEYQMGPASFQAQSPSAEKITQGRVNTNSSFSDHMHMIRGCLKTQWRKTTQIRTEIETK